jgi:predicted RNA-binding protein with PIN domain
MNFLIDGHNLIGSKIFPDIRLSDEDDEAKLVRRLRIWQSRTRASMTVIFDRGIPGGLDVKMGSAGVEVIFAADPAQADDLIRRRLRKAKKGLILVTNDEALLREAAVYGVTHWRGAEFVEQMKPKIPERSEAGTEEEIEISKAEVEEWLALFRARRVAKKQLKKGQQADGAGKGSQNHKEKPPARPLANGVAKRRKASGKRR